MTSAQANTDITNASDKPEQYWDHLLSELQLSGMCAELARHCLLQSHQANKMLLRLSPDFKTLCLDSAKKELQTALRQHFSTHLQLQIEIKHIDAETPAQRIERNRTEKQLSANKMIRNDAFVTMLQAQFDARIVPNSIKLNE